jgi:hypothetical protein
VNGTSFCAVTRDDRCVESLYCISCFCSFGFWGWGRKTAVNGSLRAVSSGDRCGGSLDLRGLAVSCCRFFSFSFIFVYFMWTHEGLVRVAYWVVFPSQQLNRNVSKSYCLSIRTRLIAGFYRKFAAVFCTESRLSLQVSIIASLSLLEYFYYVIVLKLEQ